jgi:hypothetical protein
MAAAAAASLPDRVLRIIGGELGETRALGARIDWLTIAFRVTFSPEATSYLAERKAFCSERIGRKKRSKCGFELGELGAELRTHRASGALTFENGDVRGRIDLDAAGGWTVSIELRQTYLATHTLLASLELMQRTARAFGKVAGERIRRLDFAADFAGWPLLAEDAAAFLKPRQGKGAEWKPEAKDLDGMDGPALREYRRGAQGITGWTICPGNFLMARLYDKTAELAIRPIEKTRVEQARWDANGWKPGERVTRLEFQIRGKALDELELRAPAALVMGADQTWQYLTRRWLRLIVLESSSRLDRCATDPRWRAAQAVIFEHQASPAKRVRRSSAASARQALGCILSGLAAAGELPTFDVSLEQALRIEEDRNAGKLTGPIAKEHAITYAWSDREARCFTTHALEQYAAGFVRLISAELGTDGPREAAIGLIARVNASALRARQDGETPPPPIRPNLAELLRPHQDAAAEAYELAERAALES